MSNTTLACPRLSHKPQPLCRAIQSILLVSSLTSSLFYATQTSAADEDILYLEPIAVTAEKREAEVLDVPASILAKTGKELEDANVNDLTELSQQVPNLHVFSWGGRRDTNVFIRGIGPGLFTEPTVGFYVDGVSYTNNGAFDLDLTDIERVEVLRGPQGTLYGGNSLAGVVNIITRQPDNTKQARATLSWDSLAQKKLAASFNTPLKKDELFLGMSLSTVNGGGYIDNTASDNDLGEQQDLSAKTKLRWLANERLEALLSVDYERFRSDSYALGPYDAIKNNPDKVSHDFNGVDERDTKGAALTLKWSGDQIDFTSVTAWRDRNNVNSADQDGGSNALYAYHSRSEEQQKQLTQELRWASNAPGNLRWLTGLYAHKSDFENQSHNALNYTAFNYGGPYVDTSEITRDNRGYATFGQLDYDLNDNWTMTGGLRLDHEKREAKVIANATSPGANSGTFQGSKSFNEWLPKVGLSYTTDNDTLIYSSVSKGYRAGGFDTLYPNLSNPTYDSETSINYELGYKTSLLNNRLEFSATAFWIDIKDQQVQQLFNGSTIVTDNAGASRSRGLELESRFKPASGWLVALAGNYTNAKYKDYKGFNPATAAPTDYTGNRLPNTPKVTANVSVQNRRAMDNNLTWFGQIDNQYVGSYFFDASNRFEQNAYHMLNLKTGVEAKNWSAYIWVKNALDVYYSKIEYDFGFGRTAEAGDPRRIGITFKGQF